MATPFITSADLASYTQNDALDSGLAIIALDAASQAVRAYCDQDLDVTTYTSRWLNGKGTRHLVLPNFPINTITALTAYTLRDDASPESLTENVDYVLDYKTGVITRIDGGVFANDRQNVSVSYTYGKASIASDIRLVALQVAARIYEVGIVTNESNGGQSATYMEGAGQLNRNEKDALRRYRA